MTDKISEVRNVSIVETFSCVKLHDEFPIDELPYQVLSEEC